MKTAYAAVALVLVAGCAPQVQEVYTANGTKGHTINCTFDPEMLNGGNWGLCYRKASELCGSNGYDLIEKSDDRAQYSSFNAYGGSSGTVNQRIMVVACKGAKKPA